MVVVEETQETDNSPYNNAFVIDRLAQSWICMTSQCDVPFGISEFYKNSDHIDSI